MTRLLQLEASKVNCSCGTKHGLSFSAFHNGERIHFGDIESRSIVKLLGRYPSEGERFSISIEEIGQ